MEKVININFQGRIIAIEENAYNSLKQYIDGLRAHFAKEESNDEIINDIENRIAELLSEQLKHGAVCIGMKELNAVMDSIGRLEDIVAAEAEENAQQGGPPPPPPPPPPPGGDASDAFRHKLYRNADDKLIAGVCSGIALRTGLDPALVRIIFVVLSGALFWIYILMWIIIPEQSVKAQVTRRLYRNPDDKMLAGVCGGLAAYFHTDAWIMRAIFALPFIIGISSGDDFFPHWGWGPRIFAGSLGGTMFITYVILWIVTPFATTATSKMEMRGEKIDMNSIKAATQARAAEAAQATRRAGRGIGHIISVLFKAFFLFIGGMVALSLFGALIGLVFVGSATMPYTDFLFEGREDHIMAWTGLALTMGIPLLALVVWLVRRLTGARSGKYYLGYIFGCVWLIGIVCVIVSVAGVTRNFSTRAVVEQTYLISQPASDMLYINVADHEASGHHARHDRWFGDFDNRDAPFRCINGDSLWLNNVKVNIEQSADTLYHVYSTRASRGKSAADAKQHAENFEFNILQEGSIITLADGFVISKKDKFRNQQVLITVEVPKGKRIQLSNDVDDYSWYTINSRGRGYYERRWHDDYDYSGGHDYIMTDDGLIDPADTVSTENDF